MVGLGLYDTNRLEFHQSLEFISVAEWRIETDLCSLSAGGRRPGLLDNVSSSVCVCVCVYVCGIGLCVSRCVWLFVCVYVYMHI